MVMFKGLKAATLQKNRIFWEFSLKVGPPPPGPPSPLFWEPLNKKKYFLVFLGWF